MPDNDPECNPPPEQYEEALQSYLFKPLRETWIKIIQESKNANSEPYFDHVSQWLIHPQLLEADGEFPTIFVLTPDGTFERHGMGKSLVQYKALITLQFEYYCKHYKRNVTNECEHFIERIIYLVMKNQNVPFNKIGTTNLCTSQLTLNNFSINFFGRGKHVIRYAIVNAVANIPALIVEPP